MTQNFAERLYTLRKSRGFSQEELAEHIGVSRQAVSKWERGEASPDTDNIIQLSKIYGVSLDELVYGGDGAGCDCADGETNSDNEDKSAGEQSEDDDKKAFSWKKGIHVHGKNGDKVDISFKDGIHVEEKDGDTVHIGWKGIHVEEKDGDAVHISNNGVHIEENGHVFTNKDWYCKPWKNPLFIIYPLLVLISYLAFGFLGICGGFAVAWVHFFTIPVYYSLIKAIYKRKAAKFSYSVFMLYIFLTIGMYCGIWHPTWVLFITIPFFYAVCKVIRKARKARKAKSFEM